MPRASGFPFCPLRSSAGPRPEAFAVVGTALALDPIDRRSGARRLQVLLQRGLVVAQRLRRSATPRPAARRPRPSPWPRTKARTGSRPPSRNSAPITASMVFESTVLLRRRPLLSSPRLRRRCLPSPIASATCAMCCRLTNRERTRVSSPSCHSGCRVEQRLRHHQPQHRVAQKLKALVVAGADFFAAVCLRQLVGQRTVRQRAHQQFGARELVPQCGFKFFQICFHVAASLPAVLTALDVFGAPFAARHECNREIQTHPQLRASQS